MWWFRAEFGFSCLLRVGARWLILCLDVLRVGWWFWWFWVIVVFSGFAFLVIVVG